MRLKLKRDDKKFNGFYVEDIDTGKLVKGIYSVNIDISAVERPKVTLVMDLNEFNNEEIIIEEVILEGK